MWMWLIKDHYWLWFHSHIYYHTAFCWNGFAQLFIHLSLHIFSYWQVCDVVMRNHCPCWSIVNCNYRIHLFKQNKTYEQMYTLFRKSSALHIPNTLPRTLRVIILCSSDSWGNHSMSSPAQKSVTLTSSFSHYHQSTSLSLSNIMQAFFDQTTTNACLFSDRLRDKQLNGTKLPSC